MHEYIKQQRAKTGIVWTYATLEVDHKDFDPTNNHPNNLQFLTPEENSKRSNGRPCRIWEIGKKDTAIRYDSLSAAAKAMGYHKSLSFFTNLIINSNKHKTWRGEFIVEKE